MDQLITTFFSSLSLSAVHRESLLKLIQAIENFKLTHKEQKQNLLDFIHYAATNANLTFLPADTLKHQAPCVKHLFLQISIFKKTQRHKHPSAVCLVYYSHVATLHSFWFKHTGDNKNILQHNEV